MQKLTKLDWKHTEANRREVMALLQEMGLDPGGLYQELEMSSRFINTHRDVSYANQRVNLHSHNYTEVIHCRTSAGVEYLIGPDRTAIGSRREILSLFRLGSVTVPSCRRRWRCPMNGMCFGSARSLRKFI